MGESEVQFIMTETEQKIRSLIEKANSILIFSHIRPDWDAVASSLLTADLIEQSNPEKKLRVVIEQGELSNIDYLPNSSRIRKSSAITEITDLNPELILIVDCPEITRISFDEARVIDYFEKTECPIVAIDHHALGRQYAPTLISNHGYSSAVEEVYSLFVKTFNFPETPNTPTYLASGILSDTNNFIFLKNSYELTLDFAKYLIKNGIDLAEVDRQQNMYDKDHLLILAQFMQNITILDGVSYSFVPDAFFIANPQISRDHYTIAKETFTLHFLRQVSQNSILFVIYPEEGLYKGSLRGVKDEYDMTVFASHLNGGGHKSACGFKLTDAKTIQEAIETTLSVINSHKGEAKILSVN